MKCGTSFLLVTYFSVFKFWFTRRASASVEAPEPPISLHPRLWKSEYSRISTNSACYNRALCGSGFRLITCLIVIIPNSLKITVVFSLYISTQLLKYGPSLKPGPDWINRKCTRNSCYCVCSTANELEKSQCYWPVSIWTVAGMCDGSFLLWFQARHLKNKQLGNRRY